MESLALAAVVVILGTFVSAVVSAFALRRPPSSIAARAALVPFTLVARVSGARLALLPIGEVTRVAGALAAVVGGAALYRLAKGTASAGP
jgi:hypothetical protein